MSGGYDAQMADPLSLRRTPGALLLVAYRGDW
jgi:hypothetical protein